MSDFKPSYKQYKALQFLWAVPLTREIKTENWYRFEEVLDENWFVVIDDVTAELGYGWAAWGWKILANDGVILTQFWWKKWIDLNVWDKVCNPDGTLQKIVAITEEMVLPKCRVSFSDWTFTDVAEWHLWQAWRARKSRWIWMKRTFWVESSEVIETKWLKDWLDRWYSPLIPVTKEVSLQRVSKEKNKLDPYLLWALLWDWCITWKSSNINITCANEDKEHWLKYIWKEDVSLIWKEWESVSISFKWEKNIYIKNKLKLYKLLGTYSDTKFIPETYKYASIEDRYEIVRWLMDTDWYKRKDAYAAYYYTTSEQLADDMVFILRSLWAVVTVTDRIWKYKKDWVVHECKKFYTLYIKHRDPDMLFKMTRKQQNLKPKEINKTVTKVEVLDENITWRCITVSNPNWLYITNDFIVTHNSRVGAERLHMMCQRYPWTRRFVWREELKRLKMSTLLTIFEVLQIRWMKDLKDFWYNDIKGLITFSNGSTIWLLDLAYMPSDPLYSRYWSMEFTGWFIDEANEVNPGAIGILKTRVRFKLEQFCSHCAWPINKDKDFLYIDKVINPDPEDASDEIEEKNKYMCPNCKRETYWLLGRILNTFNPDKWWVYSTYYKPWKEWKLKSYVKFIRALATDNPYLPKKYIRTLKQADKVTKERLLYGNFDYDASPWRLYEYEDILNMFEERKLSEAWTKYITCDVARHGRDKAIIFLWENWTVISIYIYFKSETTTLEEKIDDIAAKHWVSRKRIVIDEDGIGGWVVDHLWCLGFINNSSPIQPKDANSKLGKKNNYQNLKTQAYFKIADFLEKMKVNLDDIHVYWGEMSIAEIKMFIIEELDVITEADIDKDWPKRIISKKEVKEKLGRSPDFGDNFAFRMIWELKEIKKSFSMVI